MAEKVCALAVSETPMCAVAEGIRQAWSTMAAFKVTHLRWLLGVVSGTPSMQGAVERSSGQTASGLGCGDRWPEQGSAGLVT